MFVVGETRKGIRVRMNEVAILSVPHAFLDGVCVVGAETRWVR